MLKGRNGRNFVKQTRLGVKELKRYFNEAPSGWSEGMTTPPKCFYLSDIGFLAIIEADKEATEFLIDNLAHDDCFVRFAAAAFLGDLSPLHPCKWEAYRALNNLMQREKDYKVKDMILHARMLLKKKLGNNHQLKRKTAFY